MKILIVTSYGFDARMRNFIEFIAARLLVKNKWRVFACAKSETKKTEIYSVDGIEVFKTSGVLAGFFYVFNVLLFKKIKIIHIFNLRNNPLGIMTSVLNKLFFRKPMVFTEYGLLHDHYICSDRDDPFPLTEKFNKNGMIFSFFQIFRNINVKQNLKNYLFHFPITHADKIIFISKHNLELARILGLKNFEYLPHIFDDGRWSDDGFGVNEKNFKKFKIVKNYSDKNLILFIGQMKLRKGWDVIIKAMSFLKSDPSFKLIFITPSTNEEPRELSAKINILNIREKIIFLGKVEGEELKRIYELSKVVVVPSRYEGFGLAVAEAWELKKPVVASNIEAINEHLIDGYNGLLVPSENPEEFARKIKEVFENKDIQEKIIKGGSETLKKMKSEEEKNKWLSFYQKLI